MTDSALTPEVYGDFGRFLDEIGLRKKAVEPAKTTQKPQPQPRTETNDWYKQGKECPF